MARSLFMLRFARDGMSLFSFFWDSNEHWLLHTRDLSMTIILIISEVFLYFISQSVDFDDQNQVYRTCTCCS